MMMKSLRWPRAAASLRQRFVCNVYIVFTENHLTHYTDYSKVFTVIAKSSCALYTNVMCVKCQKKFYVHSTPKGDIKFQYGENSLFTPFLSPYWYPFPILIGS